jgi:hypothetical protein
VPAAAVIPAPIAYIKVVAVKKLVVGFTVPAVVVRCFFSFNPSESVPYSLTGDHGFRRFGGRWCGFERIKATLLPGRKIVKNLSPVVRI